VLTKVGKAFGFQLEENRKVRCLRTCVPKTFKWEEKIGRKGRGAWSDQLFASTRRNETEWEGEPRSVYIHMRLAPPSTPLSHSHGKSQGFLLIEVKTSSIYCYPPAKSGHFHAEIEQLRLVPCSIRRTLIQLAPDSTMWHETKSSDLQTRARETLGEGWLMMMRWAIEQLADDFR